MRPVLGDFGLVRGKGLVGLGIQFGQLFNGDGSEYTHAFIVVGDHECVEAAPLGARIADTSKYKGRVVYSHFDLSPGERYEIVHRAVNLIGTPYYFIDYIALALHRAGIHAFDHRMQRTDRLICSQLVDLTYEKAGVHLFDDGRTPSDVTPGDLANLLLGTSTANVLTRPVNQNTQ